MINNLIKNCVCGKQVDESFTEYDNAFSLYYLCSNCKFVHQKITDHNRESFINFLKNHYQREFQIRRGRVPIPDRYNKDYENAEEKFEFYNKYLVKGSKGLDVGCGTPGFLDYANGQGYECLGVEVSNEIKSDRIITGMFEDIQLESESFEFVTMHDYIQTVLDMNIVIEKAYTILKQDGILFIEWPVYFLLENTDNWHALESLWITSGLEFRKFLERKGFSTLERFELTDHTINFIMKKVTPYPI